MVKIIVETYGEDMLRKLFSELSHKEDWDEECELCRMPTLLHCDTNDKRILGSCTRRTELTDAAQNKADSELLKSWSLFRKKMEPIRKWYKEEMDKKLMNSELLKGLQEMSAANQQGLENMTAAIVNGNKHK